ncbi:MULTISPECIES: hypothetical protein [Bacillales]|uniref:Uncharacterized protein n=1 Tax=Cytobacillus purgationiresistens TaxID=863449 RepID=A0ABU0AIR0_9BACI|nr:MULTISPECIES: hypothetical protein [Bacillales]MDQ0271148.1 hypothetical protein [Cytobacillus purgationiresistens]
MDIKKKAKRNKIQQLFAFIPGSNCIAQTPGTYAEKLANGY